MTGQTEGPDIATALADYKAQMEAVKAEQAETSKAIKEMADAQKQDREHAAQQTVESDIKSAVATLKDADDLKDIPDAMARTWMGVYSEDNAAFADAFEKRGENPKGWADALAEAKTKFTENVMAFRGGKDEADAVADATTETSGRREIVDTGKAAEHSTAELLEVLDQGMGSWEHFLRKKLAEVGG